MATAPTIELQSVPEGGAIAILITAPSDSVAIRIIRRHDAYPTSQEDIGPGVLLVERHPSLLSFNGHTREWLDFGTADEPLIDGRAGYYAAWSKDAEGTWSAAATATATPETRIELRGPNPMAILLQRLPERLKRLLATGRFALTKETLSEGIHVYEAFPFDEDATPWPCFSVHLDGYAEAQRFVGETGRGIQSYADFGGDERAQYDDVTIAIMGWSMQETVRGILRDLLREAMVTDRLFYERAGLHGIRYEGPRDVEDMSMQLPGYLVSMSVTCQVLAQPLIRTTSRVETAEARRMTQVATGTVTGSTASTVVDASQSWTTDQWVRTNRFVHFVRIRTGVGVGQQRRITANTSTTLTVTPDWGTPPVGGTFEILRLEEQTEERVEYQTIG